MHAIEAEIRARLEAEAESRIAAAVAAATANMKCKMEQALELAVAEAVTEANRCCDVRCAAEVAAALKGAECKSAPAPARIAIPADAIFDAHIDKLMCRAHKKFDFFDLDGNGLLDGDELVHLGEWLWSCFHPGEEASEQKKEAEGLKTLFRHDENGDGALSFEEFEGWFRKTCAAIEKYRRGLAEKPNLKVKPPVKQKMPKRQVAEVVEAHLPSEQVTVTAAPSAPVVPRLKLGGVPSVVPRLKLGFNLGGVKKAEEVAPEATPEKPSSDDLDSMLAALGTPSPAKTGYNSY